MRETRRDIVLGPGLIAAACIALAFVSIGLFVRMAPAIRAILDENVHSQRAAVDILEAVSTRRGLELDEGQQARIADALARARGNITLDGEAAIVEALEDSAVLAFIGAEAGLSGLVTGARKLWELNEAAMLEADASASRLGTAGAWTAAFGGLGVVTIALLAVVRLRRRIAVPVEDIERVLRGQANGLRQLRCHPLPATAELERIRSEINMLLDERAEARSEPRPAQRDAARLRELLVGSLEAMGRPAALVGADGHVIAANTGGLSLLGADAGGPLRERTMKVLQGAEADDGPDDRGLPHSIRVLDDGRRALVLGPVAEAIDSLGARENGPSEDGGPGAPAAAGSPPAEGDLPG